MAKATFDGANKVFKPVTISITLENQMELDVFASLFNWVPLAEFPKLTDDWCKSIREAAEMAGGNSSAMINDFNQNLCPKI